MPKINHTPVLKNEVLHYLSPQKGERYLDLTAGYGGHAEAVLALTANTGSAVLVDRDQKAADFLRRKFRQSAPRIIRGDFLSVSQRLTEEGEQFDLILADLGLSSQHIDQANRGFSLRLAGPLDMRMDQNQELSAYTIVNSWEEAALSKIISQYGEDPRARQIAKHIVESRPLSSTDELATVVAQATQGYSSPSRRHPATRTFQAIRMVVNDEVGQLSQSLTLWSELLTPGGRLGVISFHSLEDRIVKQFFSEIASPGYDSNFQLLTKKPILATQTEVVSNPRARSARLRAVAKIKIK